ncbi:Uncharacterised protein [Clostridioides difficile]|nr:hypothetical protein BN163_210019 [Clostridioides difficile T5]CCL00054.1 hypothetical protein BN166_240019 [Clostridioides difficile E10]VFD80530.1 Uncharacterised protein [Clostridioides difficile]VFG69579.1 Uncharacterised protein [Clostridioides difficile]VFG85974.1 Uncharacterised protein [Clostridioides difficile]
MVVQNSINRRHVTGNAGRIEYIALIFQGVYIGSAFFAS